ncbi:MAG: tyrosine-type recombinase/integrase [Ignavibacteriae bacterium]|nr:tyrosine-type recombinase/integrase [Ignavibacteriota bacterium]
MKQTKFYLVLRGGVYKILLSTELRKGKVKQSLISLYTTKKGEAKDKFKQFLKEQKVKQSHLILLTPEDDASFKNQIPEITLQLFYEKILSILECNLTKGTQKIYRLAVQNFTNIIGDKYLSKYTMFDVEEYKAQRLKSGTSPSTINMDISTLKALFNLAIQYEYLTKNVFTKIKKFKIMNKEIQTLTNEQMDTIINYPSKVNDTVIKAIFKFCRYSGLRITEILNIKWSDINTSTNSISIRSNKVYKMYHIHINNKLKETLQSLVKEQSEDFMFKPYTSTSAPFINRHLKRIIAKHPDIPKNLHIHNFRHTFITNKIQSGVPIAIVQNMVNHADVKTTMQYTHLNCMNKEVIEYSNLF